MHENHRFMRDSRFRQFHIRLVHLNLMFCHKQKLVDDSKMNKLAVDIFDGWLVGCLGFMTYRPL